MRSTLIGFLLVCSGFSAFAQGTTANAGPDTSLCVDHYTLQASLLGVGEFGTWTMVSGCGTINDPTAPNSEFVNICIGTNVLVWTVTGAGGTPITSDIVVITYYDVNAQAADAGPDQVVCLPVTNAFMSANCTTWPSTGYWTVVVGSFTIVDPTDCFTQFVGLTSGVNIAAWNVDNGPCGFTSDTLTITGEFCAGLAPLASDRALTVKQDAAGTWIFGDAPVDGLRILDPLGREVLSFGARYGAGWSVQLPPTLRSGAYVVASERSGGSPVVRRFIVE
ncbi:MAG: hypothetical protein ABI432_11670 [Flavobacteriales bacterium]